MYRTFRIAASLLALLLPAIILANPTPQNQGHIASRAVTGDLMASTLMTQTSLPPLVSRYHPSYSRMTGYNGTQPGELALRSIQRIIDAMKARNLWIQRNPPPLPDAAAILTQTEPYLSSMFGAFQDIFAHDLGLAPELILQIVAASQEIEDLLVRAYVLGDVFAVSQAYQNYVNDIQRIVRQLVVRQGSEDTQ